MHLQSSTPNSSISNASPTHQQNVSPSHQHTMSPIAAYSTQMPSPNSNLPTTITNANNNNNAIKYLPKYLVGHQQAPNDGHQLYTVNTGFNPNESIGSMSPNGYIYGMHVPSSPVQDVKLEVLQNNHHDNSSRSPSIEDERIR